MKYGILGGTFDPPHLGHLRIAQAARDQLKLDEVIWIPAGKNPLKQSSTQSPPKRRLDMVKLTIEDEPKMSATDIDISRGGLSFAVETLEELHMLNPGDYWWIMGSDSLDTIYNWKQPDKMARLCRLAVAIRPPFDQERALRHVPDYMIDRIDFLDLTALKTSSTNVRAEVFRGDPDSSGVSDAVWEYIQKHHLYAR